MRADTHPPAGLQGGVKQQLADAKRKMEAQSNRGAADPGAADPGAAVDLQCQPCDATLGGVGDQAFGNKPTSVKTKITIRGMCYIDPTLALFLFAKYRTEELLKKIAKKLAGVRSQ